MTGVDIVGALLRADADLAAIVAVANIKAGVLPDGVTLPALLVRSVGRNERVRLKRVGMARQTERVAVTVRARNYREQVQVMAAVLSICAGWNGDASPARRIAILNGGTGPDVTGPGNSFEQTQDFRVSFDAPV